MSQVKLNHVAGLSPLDTVFSDQGPFRLGPAPSDSFKDHLERAERHSDDVSTAVDREPTARHASSDTTAPPADDVRAEVDSDEPVPAENDSPGDPVDANETETDADRREETEPVDAGSESREEQPAEDESVVNTEDVVAGVVVNLVDETAGQQQTAGQGTGDKEAEAGKDVKAADQSSAENADSRQQAVIEELDASDKASSAEVAEKTDDSGQETVKLSKPDAEAVKATAGKDPSQQGDADQATAQSIEVETEADRDALTQARDRKELAKTANPVDKGQPQHPTQNPAAVADYGARTALDEQATSAGEKHTQPADGTAKPVGGGTSEGQADAAARVAPGQTTQANSAQTPSEVTESDRVNQARFVRRVARAFSAVGNQNGSVRLQLHPPELGSLRLEISVRNGIMTARMEAETAQARNLLLDNLPALRDRLAQQDIKVEQFNVDLTDRSPGGLPEQQADQTGSQHRGPEGDREQAHATGEGTNENTPDPGAAQRLGEGNHLNVVV